MSAAPETREGSGPALYPRRWAALGVIAISQLMVVLDATIVNIALPSARDDLGITEADQQWVVTAYTLAFGGLLLLGGRIADYWGRKRTFMVGAIGFAAASAIGGLATTGPMLFGARALQGVFGALLAPASLALLTVLFTDARERAKAFAVYGAIAGGGEHLFVDGDGGGEILGVELHARGGEPGGELRGQIRITRGQAAHPVVVVGGEPAQRPGRERGGGF